MVFAFASVVEENYNNGGLTWNTNNGTNSLLVKHLPIMVFAFASVVGENYNNGGRTWNTNNGTIHC